ncbi:SRPBCC domain-containing protein [Micromonospora sp. NPDC048830]|uniref:SRPBCC domain-containing protein n=1 Tax=Micromonospora sp. NPDC048830 TaxID=3364257 RepID=UPI00371AE154
MAAPAADVFTFVSSPERVAGCLPGARIIDGFGNEYTGEATIKVGPITTRYQGTATVLERDEAACRIVIRASGRDAGGHGGVDVTFAVTVNAVRQDVSSVELVTDLRLRGLVAQIGGNAVQGVADKLIQEFVENVGRVGALRVEGGLVGASAAAVQPLAGPAAGSPGTVTPDPVLSGDGQQEPAAAIDPLAIVRGQVAGWVRTNQTPLLVGAVLGALATRLWTNRRARQLPC